MIFKAAETYPDITFVTVNFEVFTSEAAELEVTMVPTLKFVEDRTVVCSVRYSFRLFPLATSTINIIY